MKKQHINNFRLGILVVTATLLLIVSLYIIGNNKNLFGSSFSLHTTFENVNGLQKGNNVRYAGINAGTVEDIVLNNDTTITVTLTLNTDFQGVILSNSIATIGTDGLMGNKLVNIEPGPGRGQPVQDGDNIFSLKSIDTEEMLRTLEYTNNNVAVVSANLKNITDNIHKSRGTLYTVLMDTAMAKGLKNTMDNMEMVSSKLNGFTASLAQITYDINHNEGLLGTVIKDTSLANDLQITVSSLRNTAEAINQSSRELDVVLTQINHGKGPINTLLHDSITAEQLEQGIANFNLSVIKLNEDLEALKHSFLLKRYFRKQAKTKN
jgi:phospholipid/cholesterol/gamma-HCH transport system substrate-binding protein